MRVQKLLQERRFLTSPEVAHFSVRVLFPVIDKLFTDAAAVKGREQCVCVSVGVCECVRV